MKKGAPIWRLFIIRGGIEHVLWNPYCSSSRVVMVVVVDFLVTICPCPVFAAAAGWPVFSSFLMCTQGIVASEGDCQMAAAVDNIRRQFFFLVPYARVLLFKEITRKWIIFWLASRWKSPVGMIWLSPFFFLSSFFRKIVRPWLTRAQLLSIFFFSLFLWGLFLCF